MAFKARVYLMLSPLVSVVVPTHNRSELLARALDSLLRQTYENIEVIVIDDGSTDNTRDFLKSIPDSRLVVVGNSIAMGACNARNKGIKSSKGEFVTFLDDDDEFHPSRIERMLSVWRDEWAYVATGHKYIKRSGRSFYSFPDEIITLESMLLKISTGNSVLTKRERLVFLGGFDESLTSSQDYDMWLRLNEEYGDAYSIREPLLVMHTDHNSPRITISEKKARGHFYFYTKHKSKMSYKQRKTKLFEVYRYKNKKTRVGKAFMLGSELGVICIVRFIIKSRLYK